MRDQDVGFEYNSALRNFDHHQGTLDVAWPDGTPYSACGLVWAWLREQNAWPSASNEILDAVEERLIKRADRFDNGIGGPWAEGQVLFAYNSPSNPVKPDAAFHKALAVAGDIVDNTFHGLTLELAAKAAVQKALASGLHEPHAILEMGDDSVGRVAEWAAELSDNRVNLVIVPRQSPVNATPTAWTLITTPLDPSDPFSRKSPAPEAWRGRSNFTVVIEGGTRHIDFCHKNGFLTIVRGSHKDALAAGRAVVENAHPHLFSKNGRRPMP